MKPGSKKGPLVEVQDDSSLVVFLPERPVDGAANEALIKLLAAHFSCPKSSFEIEAGHSARVKRIRIDI